MLEIIIRFFTAASVAELFIIIVAKTVEVSLATVRNIMINRGYRREGTIISFFEIVLWTFIASRVINGIIEAPVKGLAYSLGYSLGVYFGSVIEAKIALGKVLVQTIISEQNEQIMTPLLRKMGFAVTTVKAEGRDSKKTMLMIFTNRKGKEQLVKEIKNIDDAAMVIINDVSSLQGGHLTALRGIIK